MTWPGYPRRDSEWFPGKPNVGQVALGVLVFLAVAGLLLYWSAGESNPGHRVFLWVMAGVALLLGIWRLGIGVLLVREGRRRRRAVRGP